MIDSLLETLARLIRQNWGLAPALAFVAGILTSVTPCALASMPLLIGYIGGTRQKNTGRAFRLSVVFAIGSAVAFVALGVITSAAGKLMGTSGSWQYFLLGALMVLMALQTWELVNIIPHNNFTIQNTKRGYIGAFIAGILGGVFSSPCATPVLVVLLGVLAQGGNMIRGAILMLCYSLGHSCLAIVAGTSLGFVQKISAYDKNGRFSNVLKAFMGTAILAVGAYMFYLGC